MANSTDSLMLMIISTDGRSSALELESLPSSTVLDLKNRITLNHSRKPPTKDQRLIFGGRILEDATTLEQIFQKSSSRSFKIHLVLDSDRNSAPSSPSTPSSKLPEFESTTETDPNENDTQSSAYEQYLSQLNQYNRQLQQFMMNPMNVPSDVPSQSQAYLKYCHTHYQMYANLLAYQRHVTPMTNQPSNSQTASDNVVTPPATPPPQQVPPPAAAAANNNANNNEFEQENDILGVLNMLAELFVLCSIIYFYSTFNRFLVVFFIFVLLYLHCRGYLSIQRRRRVQPAAAAPAGPGNEGEPVPGDEENQGEPLHNEGGNQRHTANDGSRPPETIVTPARLLITAVSAFFSSLIPERPQHFQQFERSSIFFMQPITNFFSNAQQQIASLYTFQDTILYQPNEPESSRTTVQTPDIFHMPYETVTINTPDNVKLHGFLIKQINRTSEQATLIFFHGNAGNIGHRLHNAQLLYHKCKINILLFDYRGYGKSTGTPSEEGLYTDALAVFEYVRKRDDLNQEKIFLFGRSLGGAVALHLAYHLSQNNITPPLLCVMVENTFTSIPDMAKRLFQVSIIDYLPNWCYKNVYPSINKIKQIKVPVLFLSGGQDELVPPQMMQKLHEDCRSSKKVLIVFPEGQHNTTWLASDYADQIQNFLVSCYNNNNNNNSSSNNSNEKSNDEIECEKS